MLAWHRSNLKCPRCLFLNSCTQKHAVVVLAIELVNVEHNLIIQILLWLKKHAITLWRLACLKVSLRFSSSRVNNLLMTVTAFSVYLISVPLAHRCNLGSQGCLFIYNSSFLLRYNWIWIDLDDSSKKECIKKHSECNLHLSFFLPRFRYCVSYCFLSINFTVQFKVYNHLRLYI